MHLTAGPHANRVAIWYDIKLYTQPTDMTCWSAATTMLLGSSMSVGPGSAILGFDGGLEPSAVNIQKFAESYGLLLYWPQSWTPKGIARLMLHGPIAVFGLLPSAHVVLAGAIDTDLTAAGTRLTLYDPWPKNGFKSDHVTAIGQGQKFIVNMVDLYKLFPAATMYLMQPPVTHYPRHSHVVY